MKKKKFQLIEKVNKLKINQIFTSYELVSNISLFLALLNTSSKNLSILG